MATNRTLLPDHKGRRREGQGRESSTSVSALPRLDSRTFLRGVVERALGEMPGDLPPLHSVTYSYMAQLWSGNKQLHYEAWIRDRLGVIELGLHFEADALTNARLLAAFRARERSIRRTLGTDTRIETWDRGWARVWEPVALVPLDRVFLEKIGRRIAAYVTALEPFLRSEVPSDVAWTESRRRR